MASQSSQDEVPVVALDYGYLGDREDANPIICGHDSEDKWFYGLVVESKGASQQYAWKELAEQIGRAGHPKLSIQTDNEPAIIALKEAVIKYLTQHFGQKVIDRGARLKDSQANGRAEMAVREVKAKSRVFWQQVKDRMGLELSPSDECLTWLVSYASLSICLGRRGQDGLTAYRQVWERIQKRIALLGRERDV